MIDDYQKETELRNAGHDEFWLDTLTPSKISRLWFEEIGEQNMFDTIKEKGEDEGETHRIWLSDLNGMCNMNGHTDIMSAVACKRLDGTNCVSIQVNSPDDSSTVWADIYEFDHQVADLIYDQIINYKK